MRPAFDFSSPIKFEICAIGGGFYKDSSKRVTKANGGRIRRRMAGNRVLLLGKQRELALYRAAVLRDRGFEVKAPTDLNEAIVEITSGGYDVAVLSYTLSSDEVERMAELVRQACPNCPLVTISTTGRMDRRVNPDDTVLADEGPPALIRALQRLRAH
jgi:CheY-like chemotaxis protein